MREKPQMASMNAIHFTKKDTFSVIPVEMNHPRYYSAWSCFLCGSYLTEGKKPKQQQQTQTQKAQNKQRKKPHQNLKNFKAQFATSACS